jgi:hypothetical protein
MTLLRHPNLTVELGNEAPAVPVYRWAPHPCGGWYVADAKVYGLNCKARPIGGYA